MKKAFVIPLMLIYLLAASGVMISAHYCGENLESVSFNTRNAGCTDGACGDESQQNDDCCKDKTIAAKVTNEQITVNAFKLKLSIPEYFIPAPSCTIAFNKSLPPKLYRIKHYSSNAPPGRWQNLPLYKLHQQLVIYG